MGDTKRRWEQPHSSWQQDRWLGKNMDWGNVYIRLSVDEERCDHYLDLVDQAQEVDLGHLHIRAQPYLLVQDIQATLAVQDHLASQGPVVAAVYGDVKQVAIGTYWGCWYSVQGILVLRECYLFKRYRRKSPERDELLSMVWGSFETVLVEMLPAVRCVRVPAQQTGYAQWRWREFLYRRGYQPCDAQFVVKDI